jgi:hypothetical protein
MIKSRRMSGKDMWEARDRRVNMGFGGKSRRREKNMKTET